MEGEDDYVPPEGTAPADFTTNSTSGLAVSTAGGQRITSQETSAECAGEQAAAGPQYSTLSEDEVALLKALREGTMVVSKVIPARAGQTVFIPPSGLSAADARSVKGLWAQCMLDDGIAISKNVNANVPRISQWPQDNPVALDDILKDFINKLRGAGGSVVERGKLIDPDILSLILTAVYQARGMAKTKGNSLDPFHPAHGEVNAFMSWPHAVWLRNMQRLFKTTASSVRREDDMVALFENWLEEMEDSNKLPISTEGQWNSFQTDMRRCLAIHNFEGDSFAYTTKYSDIHTNSLIRVSGDQSEIVQAKAVRLTQHKTMKDIWLKRWNDVVADPLGVNRPIVTTVVKWLTFHKQVVTTLPEAMQEMSAVQVQLSPNTRNDTRLPRSSIGWVCTKV